ncbi:hypothetical protein GGX14DRAFT_579372 [Mycena pura]|uniref:Uncharacterized protein n=1 Tax=Mycena pura TaxID=153505 RepID=A0AAD6Y0J0_9AGAR|nr:hypothetical protein GGX14DRAFT_579372 [Mycena pura]
MASSPPTSPTLNARSDDLRSMMFASSPVRPLAGTRRTRNEIDEDDDSALLNLSSRGFGANANDLAAVKAYATRKKLKVEHIADIDLFFSANTPQLHEGLLFVNQLLAVQKIDNVVTTQPLYLIVLKVNIDSIIYGALLSPSARRYKGDELYKTVLGLVLTRRFDIPNNIDNDAAMKRKVATVIKTLGTEARSQIKKDLAKGVHVKASKDNKDPKPTMDNAASHQPLVVLAENIARHCADGFQVTPEFCARVALMRRVYMKDNSDEFWNSLEDELNFIYATATAELDPVTRLKPTATEVAKRVTKTFRFILDKDRKTHGDPKDKANDALEAMSTQPAGVSGEGGGEDSAEA